jgi:hypothetical protein
MRERGRETRQGAEVEILRCFAEDTFVWTRRSAVDSGMREIRN